MSLFSSLLTARRSGQRKSADTPRQQFYDNRCWRRILVPAAAQPYSTRSLEVACRLAQTSGATVHLAFMMEIPRSLPLNASIPDLEALAASVLKDGEDVARQYHVPVISTVHRMRAACEGVLKLLAEADCDLLVLGARPDETRGLPRDVARRLFECAPSEVVLDYIAGEQ
ncbi:MAG: universal stress protein [Capsulimonadaceae bacterium]